MSNYIVDGADLTSVANAIRTKGGTSAQLAFPAEFVSAIEDIETGGGDPYELARKMANATITEFVDDTITSLRARAFSECSALAAFRAHNVTSIGASAFANSGITSIALPHVWYATYINYIFENCKKLTIADLAGQSVNLGQFNGCVLLDTLILRRTSSNFTLGNINAFNNTPFASGKTGGTLYVPSTLIASYQSATNWSTILGYSNNRILPIEGSIYETMYGDGTPIPTT